MKIPQSGDSERVAPKVVEVAGVADFHSTTLPPPAERCLPKLRRHPFCLFFLRYMEQSADSPVYFSNIIQNEGKTIEILCFGGSHIDYAYIDAPETAYLRAPSLLYNSTP